MPGPGDREPQHREPQHREPLWRHIVGDVLRRERLGQQRTLKDVAEEARISMPYLSEIERGRKEPSSEVLAAAAHALGLSLADLLTGVQDELAQVAEARRARQATLVIRGNGLRTSRALGTGQRPAGTGPVSPQMRSPQVELSLAA